MGCRRVLAAGQLQQEDRPRYRSRSSVENARSEGVTMQTITYARNPLINRARWPAGPWDDEPDKVQWEDETTGYPCLAVRNRLGAWCGYVGVPKGHPFFAKDYGHVSDDWNNYSPAHGGLTYAAFCME